MSFLKKLLTPMWILGFSSHLSAEEICQKISSQEIKELVSKQPSTKIVVFSSWCMSCMDHIEHADTGNTLFLAAFDKPERAFKSLTRLKPGAKCRFDDGFLSENGIRILPAQLVWNADKQTFEKR